MMPATSPMTNAPPKPPPPTLDSFVCSDDGNANSNAPNMLAAIARQNRATPIVTTGDCSKLPATTPSAANDTPSVVNNTTMPST
jgi:hypothetical protein